MTDLVTDLPSLDFVRGLPEHISLRVGIVHNEPVIVLYDSKNETYTTWNIRGANDWVPALHNLLGAAMLRKHGDKAIGIHVAVAEAVVADKKLDRAEWGEVVEDMMAERELFASLAKYPCRDSKMLDMGSLDYRSLLEPLH